MIKLLLGRVLPGGLAAALVTSAISPIQPALEAFAVAANALTGDPNAGGVDMPTEADLNVPLPGDVPNPQGLLAKLFGKKSPHTDRAKREISGLAEQMQERADQRAAENKAKMGPKDPPANKPKPKSKTKPKQEAAPPEEQPSLEPPPADPPAPQ